MIKDLIRHHIHNTGQQGKDICSTGISVPGIFNPEQGTVWAPNIDGWDNFPLLKEAESAVGRIPVSIERTEISASVLGTDAAIYGTGYMAIQKMKRK